MGRPSNSRMGKERGSNGRARSTHRRSRTFSDFADEFLKGRASEVTDSSHKRLGFMVATLTRFFGGDTNIASISPGSVQRFLDQRSQSATASTIVLELNVLKRILELAFGRGMIDENRAKRIKPPRSTLRKPHPLSPTQLRLILGACPEWLRAILEITLATGLKAEQITTLRWKAITTVGAKHFLTVSKGQDSRRILLSEAAIRTLNSIRPARPGKNDLIFGGGSVTPINISKVFRRVCRSVKISDDVSIKSIRDTAVASLVAQGFSVETIAQYLGHRDLRMAAKYFRPNRVEMPRALLTIDALLS
jgi:integrase